MRLLSHGTLALTAALLTTGCGMTGTWASKDLSPEMARNEYRLFSEDWPGIEFTRATIRMNDDNTYSSEAYYGEHLHRSSGTWNKDNGTVTFVDHKGGSYTYDVELSDDHRELSLTRRIEGTDVVLVLERQ